MLCSDLERYLEAYLDGRLGRSRTTILRRHLGMCGACRARVERLRQFEREMQRRFRSVGYTRSIWQGLELDLVASSRIGGDDPPALPRPLSAPSARLAAAVMRRNELNPHLSRAGTTKASGRASRLTGVLLVALALGALYEIVRAYVQPDADEDAALQAYAELAQEGRPLALRSDDAARLQEWLSAELGAHIPAPPVPAGFHLVGADRTMLAEDEAGVLVYAPEQAQEPVLLFVRPLDQGEAEPLQLTRPAKDEEEAMTDSTRKLHEFSWDAESVRFTLVGQPHEQLRSFIE